MTPNVKELLERANEEDRMNKKFYGQSSILTDTIISLCEALILAEKALIEITLSSHSDVCDSLFSQTTSKIDWKKCDCHIFEAKEALASLRSRIEFGSGNE